MDDGGLDREAAVSGRPVGDRISVSVSLLAKAASGQD